MAQLSEVQKLWVDKFLGTTGGNGPTDTASPDAPGLGGLDTGQVQAQATQIGQKILGKAWDWITEKGETTIIIENLTSKVLRFKSKELLHPKESRFFEEPPTEIIAAKSPNDPTTVTMSVRTDKWIRGVTKADTSGFVVYEVVGTDKQRTINAKTESVRAKVRAAWSRKGQGQFNEQGTWTDLGGYKFEVQQVKGGTITYRFSEEAPNPKPKDPQPPVDPKPQEPQSGGGKDTKSAAPADTYVLFKQGKFELTSEARSRLHDFALAYLAAKSTAKIDLDGYASIEGVEASNRTLSFDRAEAVFNYLVDKEKLSKDNIQWDGKKTTSDFDPDKKKLEPNRRVTIKLK